MSDVYLSLGSNLGTRETHLNRALEKLQDKGIQPVRLSSFYETDPVDMTDQPDFLNLVCQVKTELDPFQLRLDHVVDCVATSAAHAEDGDPGLEIFLPR